MSDLTGLSSASGLLEYEADALEELVRVFRGVQGRNEELRNYYDGDITVRDFGVTVDTSKIPNDQVCDWPAQVVDALDELIKFEGYVFEDGSEDSGLNEVMKRNNLINNYQKYKTNMLIDGCMSAVVNATDNGVEVKFHSASTSAFIPDGNHDSGKIAAGFAIAKVERPTWGRKPVPMQVNLYTPGRVTIINRVASKRWEADGYDVPEKSPLMFVFTHNANGMKPFGRSRITKAVRSYTRDAVRVMHHMAISGAFYSIPKLFALGVPDSQFDDMAANKAKISADKVTIMTTDENGNTPTIQQVNGNSPQPFIDELDKLAGMLSGSTGVPLTDLGVPSSTYTSSASSSAAREKLQGAARKQIDRDIEVLNQIALAAMAVSAGVSTDDLTDSQKLVSADFADPNFTSVAAMADAGVKLCSVAPWFAETDLFLKWQGFRAADIAQVRRARDAYEASATLDAMIASIGQNETAE